jgi:hypothetical protein
MKFTEKDLHTIETVMAVLKETPYEVLNTFMGSETIQNAYTLADKFHYADYCERNNIKFEDMTFEDYEDAALAEINEEW